MLAGLLTVSVTGHPPVTVRRMVQRDVDAYRHWRAAHPDATGTEARACLVSRAVVDPDTGGRVYADVAAVLAALPAAVVVAVANAVMAQTG